MLFAYRTLAHSSTGVSPFELMFGRSPHYSDLPPISAFDTDTYQLKLRTKLAQMKDIVDASLTQAGARQKCTFDRNCNRSFQPGDPRVVVNPYSWETESSVGRGMGDTNTEGPHYIWNHRWVQEESCSHQ